MALIVNTYENDSVMALINKNSVMALYDNSVKALMQMWLQCDGTDCEYIWEWQCDGTDK